MRILLNILPLRKSVRASKSRREIIHSLSEHVFQLWSIDFLSINIFFILPSCLFFLADGQIPSKRADIVFLMDGSNNLGRKNFNEVRDFIINLIDLFYTERDDLRIGIAQYATDVVDGFFLNTYKNRDDVLNAIGEIEYKGGVRINTGAAIRHIGNVHLTKAKGSRIEEGVPQILMVVTGGRSSDDSKSAVLGLKNKRVRVFAVGVGDILSELESLASSTSTVARADTFQGLSELNEQILEALDDEVKGTVCDDQQQAIKSKKNTFFCVVIVKLFKIKLLHGFKSVFRRCSTKISKVLVLQPATSRCW